jgi:hypothetical protein
MWGPPWPVTGIALPFLPFTGGILMNYMAQNPEDRHCCENLKSSIEPMYF